VIIVFFLVSAAFGFISWRRFTYRVEAGELRIEQGIFTRKRRFIPLERIQAIDSSQGILQRVLGLTSVRIETAGGGGNQPEVNLPGVGRADSEWLRRVVATHRAGATAGADVTEDPEGTTKPLVVRKLTVADLVLAGATAGRVGVAFAIVASTLALFDEFLPIERIAGASRGVTLTGIAILLLTGLGFIWLLGVVGTILAHAGFTLTRDDDQLYIERGLLERRRATIPINRIQAIRVVERMLHQGLGLVEVHVVTAAYGKSAGESAILFPLLRRGELMPLLHEMAPAFAVAAPFSPLPARARIRYATRLAQVLPAAFVAAVIGWLAYPFGLLAILLVPAVVLLGLWQYRDAGWAFVDDIVLLRERAISRTTSIVPRRRIQQAESSQHPLQRRARLAHVSLRIASGSDGIAVGLMHVDPEMASGLIAWSSPVARPSASSLRPAGLPED
jgi:putative membrane protein